MDKKKIIIAIPARLESKRLPNKILLDICGEPMIKRVLDRVKKADTNCPLFLCTDSNQVKNLCIGWGYKVIKTSKNCSSGTERIASVTTEIISKSWDVKFNKLSHQEKDNILKNSFIINIQGDQPFINKVLSAWEEKIQQEILLGMGVEDPKRTITKMINGETKSNPKKIQGVMTMADFRKAKDQARKWIQNTEGMNTFAREFMDAQVKSKSKGKNVLKKVLAQEG